MNGQGRIRTNGWLLAGLLIALPAVGAHQQGALVFSSLWLPGGAAMNRISGVVQDHLGFIWLGTEGGLVLFDGYDFREFRHAAGDPGSLSANSVTALLVDRSGVLWVGTENAGLNRFNRDTGGFVRLGRPGGEGPLDRGISAILEDRDGRLWVAGEGGVTELVNGRAGDTLSAFTTYALALDDSGVIWAGTEFGLARFNRNRSAFELHPGAVPTGDAETGIERVVIDAAGVLWFGGTGTGLRRFDPRTGALQVYRHSTADPDSLVADDVYALLPAESGGLWVGTYGGLDRFEPATGGFDHIPTRPGVSGAITHPYVSSLFRDRQDTLWIGTYGGGVHRLGSDATGHRYFTHDPSDPDSLSGHHVQALLVAADGDIIVGTYDSGLNALDPRTGHVTRFPDLARAPEGQPRRIWQVAEDDSGRLWVATSHGVLVEVGEGQFQELTESWPWTRGRGLDTDVWCLEIDADGRVWLGTFGAGIFALDPVAEKLTHLDAGNPEYPGLTDNRISDLAFDADGRLVVATYAAGVLILEQNRFRRLEGFQPATPTTTLLPLEDDGLWVATRGDGLYWLEGNQVDHHYTREQGLPSDFVEAIGLDNQGRLWATTDNGLAVLDNPVAGFRQRRLFAEPRARVFQHGAMALDEQGQFWVGAQDGLIQFNPVDEAGPAVSPMVMVTRVATRQSSHTLALQTRWPTLSLGYDETAVSVEFAAIEFIQPDLIEYRYRLSGFDPDWVAASASRRLATYTNLSPGRYQFDVQARTPGGDWVGAEAPLEFSIASSPWLSPAAMAGYALMLVLLAYFASREWRARVRRQAAHHQALREREERLELALWGSGDWLWDWDVEGRRFYCPKMCEFLGLDPTVGWILIDDWVAFIDPQDFTAFDNYLRERMRDHDDQEYQYRIRGADGHYHWIQSRGRVVSRDPDGRPARVAGTFKDMDATKEAERRLRLAARVLEESHDAVAIQDLQFRFIQVNRAFEQVTGYREDEVRGQPASLLDSGTYPSGFGDEIRQSLMRKGRWQGEIWERKKSGDLFYSDLNISQVKDATGAVTNYVSVFSDITRRHQTEEELRYLANYDAMSGLPNRTLFAERLSHAVVRARRRISRVVVMLVDLDDFKLVNESHGHLAGDVVLKQTAERLAAVVREEDTIARLSADEFAILVEGTESDREVQDLSRVVANALKGPYLVEGTELRLSASIGMAVYPDHGNDADILTRNAQAALSAAKEEGRGQARHYEGDLRASALNRIRMADELDQALDRGELELHYQPKVDAERRAVCGVEALLRWNHGQRGLISPDEFIPLAEERGQIVDIGRWVMETAVTQILSLADHGLGPVPLAVNVSPRQVNGAGLVESTQQLLERSGFDPQMLQLELTETSMMSQVGEALSTLQRLKALSVNLVVDDFGTGYSSLSYISRLPLDQIKIDKSFVQNLEDDRFSRGIVSAVLSMAESLGLRVTAEGVEREEQFEFLRQAGCLEIQGYLIAAPMPFDQLIQFLKDRS